jgi:hypothetical protein
MSAFVINPHRFFDPAKISGLAVWLDASDASTLFNATSGGSLPANNAIVARWEDKSGNGRHFTRATANQPTRVTSAVNSKDAVRFVGAQYITRTGGTFGAADIVDVFFVSQTSDTAYVFLSSSTNGGAYYDATQNNGNSALGGFNSPTVSQYRVNGANVTNTRSALLTARGSTANILSVIGSTVTGSAWEGLELNYRHGGGFDVSDGYACELLIYSSSVSTADRNAIESYLGNKWGVTI